MTRSYLLCGILALSLADPAIAGVQCSISDWPLEMLEGTADFVRFITPGLTANGVVTSLHTSTRAAGSHAALASADAAPPLAPRNWKDRRSPTPSHWENLAPMR
jgi:hypothetical protein